MRILFFGEIIIKFSAKARISRHCIGDIADGSSGYKDEHTVQLVIESLMREILGKKIFAIINSSLNFCRESTDDKVIIVNLAEENLLIIK